jgi:hypothetical protein
MRNASPYNPVEGDHAPRPKLRKALVCILKDRVAHAVESKLIETTRILPLSAGLFSANSRLEIELWRGAGIKPLYQPGIQHMQSAGEAAF